MPVIDFDPPDRFVAGTVGPPGQRTFFLQASEGPRVTSVSLEKQQVVVLADRVNDLLDDFAGGEAADEVAVEVEDNAPLDTPIEDEFRVGTMSLGWDAERRVVILECHDGDETVELDEDGDPVIVDDGRRGPHDLPGRHPPQHRPRVRPPLHQARLGRAATLPVLRRTPGPDRPHLPTRERLQALTGVLPPSTEAEAAELLELLTLGELELEGQLVDASNLALLARLERHGVETRVMYKPVRGERPLWDFPRGTLANREAASYVVSAAGGWDVVPPTVLRDGPAGRGTVQLWIEGLDGSDAEDGPALPRPDELVDLVPRGKVEPGWLPVFEAESYTGAAGGGGPRRPAGPGRGRRPRRRHQQRRPQGLAPGAGPPRVPVGVRPRPQLPRGAQAADRALGLGGRAAARRRAVPAGRPGRRPRHRRPAAWRRLSTQLLAPAELEALRARVAGLLRTGPLPAARQPVARRPVAAAVTRPL